MADKIKHGIISSLSALGTYLSIKHFKKEEVALEGIVGSLILGGVGGILPDLIEPATHPNHRSFFHSITLLALLGYSNVKTWQSENMNDDHKLLISILTAGYGSHLLVDGLSKKGLPLIT